MHAFVVLGWESPNQCLLFAAHAHAITACFTVVSILYQYYDIIAHIVDIVAVSCDGRWSLFVRCSGCEVLVQNLEEQVLKANLRQEKQIQLNKDMEQEVKASWLLCFGCWRLCGITASSRKLSAPLLARLQTRRALIFSRVCLSVCVSLTGTTLQC